MLAVKWLEILWSFKSSQISAVYVAGAEGRVEPSCHTMSPVRHRDTQASRRDL